MEPLNQISCASPPCRYTTCYVDSSITGNYQGLFWQLRKPQHIMLAMEGFSETTKVASLQPMQANYKQHNHLNLNFTHYWKDLTWQLDSTLAISYLKGTRWWLWMHCRTRAPSVGSLWSYGRTLCNVLKTYPTGQHNVADSWPTGLADALVRLGLQSLSVFHSALSTQIHQILSPWTAEYPTASTQLGTIFDE